MEIGTAAPLNLTLRAASNPPKSPRARRNQTPTKLPAATNALFKRRAPPHLKPRLPSPPTSPVPEPTFKECRKNHAAASGGHVLDGCCEFMPSPAAVLDCAACGCHRNFHRRAPPPPISSSYRPPSAPQLLLALSGGAETAPSRRIRKRSRTKFSQHQKEKMFGFAGKNAHGKKELGFSSTMADHGHNAPIDANGSSCSS